MSDASLPSLPVALTIAGSDSGGGAGIQADLKTFQAFGVFGTSALTAITAQNTLGVFGVHAVPEDLVRQQVQVVLDDLAPRALKTGMLATRSLVETVAEVIGLSGVDRFVLDPVMVATSGDRLLDEDAVEAVRSQLLPLAALVTPNTHEAEILTGRPMRSVDDLSWAARELVEMGARAALVKGGHLAGAEVVDVLRVGESEHRWSHARIEGPEAHGTGCTLSAAVTAGLAHGRPLVEAVDAAIDFVARALRSAPQLGRGARPLNHLVSARVNP